MVDIEIRLARDEDLPNILDTLRAALGETEVLRRSPELWNWKHMLNPFGKSIVMVAARGERIAGVRALMRWELTTPSGQRIKAVRPVDTATHPEFLRMGVFSRLTSSALEIAREQGVQLIFNTPNEKSAPGYFKLGWKEVDRLGVLVRPRFGRSVRSGPGVAPAISDIAPKMDQAFETLPVIDREPLGLRTPRTAEYMIWRFGSHPTASYGWMQEQEGSALVARANTRRGLTELVVSELLGEASPSLIRAAARTAKSRYLAGWFSPNTPERRIAVRGGMIPIPGLRTLRLVALPLTELDINIFDLEEWDLSTGDLELL